MRIIIQHSSHIIRAFLSSDRFRCSDRANKRIIREPAIQHRRTNPLWKPNNQQTYQSFFHKTESVDSLAARPKATFPALEEMRNLAIFRSAQHTRHFVVVGLEVDRTWCENKPLVRSCCYCWLLVVFGGSKSRVDPWFPGSTLVHCWRALRVTSSRSLLIPRPQQSQVAGFPDVKQRFCCVLQCLS